MSPASRRLRPDAVPLSAAAADAAARRHARRRRVVLVLVALTVVLLMLDRAGAVPLRRLAAGPLGGLERALTGSSGRDLRAVAAERDRLALQALERGTTAAAADDIAAARGLDALAGATLVPARVVAWERGVSRVGRRVGLDSGSGDGVVVGAAVVSGDGLVGRVVRTDRWTSDVDLVGDPSVVVSARVGTRGALAAVSTGRLGAADSSSRLTVTAMVPGTIAEGDPVVTAGSPGGSPYPAGLRIGTVGRLDPASGQVSTSATIVPAVDVAAVEVVTVVVVPPRSGARPTLGATAGAGTATPSPAVTTPVTARTTPRPTPSAR